MSRPDPRWGRRGRRALTAAVVSVLAACTAGAGSAPHPPVGPPKPTATRPAGPQPGGALRLLYVTTRGGGFDPAAALDPAFAVTAAQRQLLRATTRQLVSYDGVDGLAARQDPKPDLATFSDVSDDKTTFTFRLRDVRWPAPLDRPVLAADLVYAWKRLCDPGAPSPGRVLFIRSVQGMAGFCAGVAAAVPDGEPAAVRAWSDSHAISGVTAKDDHTVQVAVTRPAGDFLNALALPYASPLPEDLVGGMRPGSPALRGLLPALGPYAALPGPGPGVTLVRNPVWRPETDPLRRAWADRIELRPAPSQASAAAEVAAGRADALLGGSSGEAVTAAIGAAALDPRVRTSPDGSVDLLIAHPGGTQGCAGALADPRVWRAVALGLDRAAAATAAGAPLQARPAEGLLPRAVLGHEAVDPFATPGSAGDPVAARALLAAALPGVSTARPLRCAVSVEGDRRLAAVAAALAPPLRPLGLRLVSRAGGQRADLVLHRWVPPWRGNAGRDLLEGLLQRCDGVAVRSGCSAGSTVGAATPVTPAAVTAVTAVTAAAAENDQNRAALRWAEAAAAVSAAVPVVALVEGRAVSLTSARVSGFRWFNLGGDLDLANAAVPAV